MAKESRYKKGFGNWPYLRHERHCTARISDTVCMYEDRQEKRKERIRKGQQRQERKERKERNKLKERKGKERKKGRTMGHDPVSFCDKSDTALWASAILSHSKEKYTGKET